MRLIDADAVIENQHRIMKSLYGESSHELKEHLNIDDDLSIYIHAMETYSRAKQFYYGLKAILENTPTIDAVPVVHCRDCKWYQESEKLSPNKFCFRLQHPTENRKIGYNFSPDDFCSYGKRKDCGGNG